MDRDSIENYKKGSNYEIFVHRAFRTSDNSKPGMHGSIIQNLILIESGDTSFVKWHGTFEKQLEKTKYYMHRAMDKYMAMKKIPSENIDVLRILKHRIDQARSSDQLMEIINRSIELTQIVRDY